MGDSPCFRRILVPSNMAHANQEQLVRSKLETSDEDVSSVVKGNKRSKWLDVVKTAELIQELQDIINYSPSKLMKVSTNLHRHDGHGGQALDQGNDRTCFSDTPHLPTCST